METYEQIIAEIQNKIKTNGNKEITGAILQGVLLGIIAAVQANQQGKLAYYSEDEDAETVQINANKIDITGALDVIGKIGIEGVLTVNEDSMFNKDLEVFGSLITDNPLIAQQGIALNDGNGHEYIITVDAQGNIVSTPKNP